MANPIRKERAPARVLAILLLYAAIPHSAIAQPKPAVVKTMASGTGRNERPGPGHSLTIGIPSFFDGFTALSYEHKLSARFAVAAAGGVTYNSFFMQVREQRLRDEEYTGGIVRTGPDRFDVEEEFSNRFYHEAKPGIYLAVAPKLYLNLKALNGYYLAPMIEFRDYRFRTYQGNESEFYAPYLTSLTERSVQRRRDAVSESIRCYDLSAVAGGHHCMRRPLVLAYHLGVGIRHSVATRQDFGLERVRADFYRFTNGTAVTSETRLVANIGFSFGGFW